jgi:hypothetical protein
MEYAVKLLDHTSNVLHGCCWFLVGICYMHVVFVSIENGLHLPLLVPSSDGAYFGLEFQMEFLVRMEYTCPVLV